MNISQQIRNKIQTAFEPLYFDLQNESHMHAGPATDSHFKLTVVADSFRELSKVKRHQAVYRTLKDELDGPVHALALHLFSPAEWAAMESAVNPSPKCKGKNKTIG